MAIDWTKVADAASEVANALAIKTELDKITAAGNKFYLDGHTGDADYLFTAPAALITALETRRDNHIAAAKAILNA